MHVYINPKRLGITYNLTGSINIESLIFIRIEVAYMPCIHSVGVGNKYATGAVRHSGEPSYLTELLIPWPSLKLME